MTDELSRNEVIDILIKSSSAVREQREHIRKLDAAAGDGDLGITINKGFKAFEEFLSENEEEEISLSNLLQKGGMEFNNAGASTFGVFFATACMEAAKEVKGEQVTLDTIGEMFQAAVDGIKKRGDAEVGDKTLLDALVPATETLQEAATRGESIGQAMAEAAEAAAEGAESTKGMAPKTGRAKQLGEQTKDVTDPGAEVVRLFLQELASNL